jgi:type II secretory ATPase GspE/PulE/Tfp pilus assembly ATPase PilB-like protein
MLKKRKKPKVKPQQFLKNLVHRALQQRASDIHLEPSPSGLQIRFRIDGLLRQIETIAPETSKQIIIALKVMANMDITLHRKPQDGRASLFGVDLRVSSIPGINGEKAVIRLLPRKNGLNNLENLGFTPNSLLTYQNWLKQPQGIILITGPTGSGKTSTLYTSLQTLATEFVNIITIENPVEYVLSSITQMQVNERAGMTLASSLRGILHQDPDIIMLGEIRDRPTAETVIQAALTGHLVLTTLHTNDALSALPRLKSLCPEPDLINNALLGVVAQRLLRKICPHCGEPYLPTVAELKAINISPEAVRGWRQGAGCSKCSHSGYLGREGIFEVLDVDRDVRRLIDENVAIDFYPYLSDRNFTSFKAATMEKLATGVTTVAEILRVLPRSAFEGDFREDRSLSFALRPPFNN